MNKLILYSILFLQFAFAQAQPYQSIFGDSTTRWNILDDVGFGASTSPLITKGDSIINGNLYKILGCVGNCISGFIREDTTSGKIWFIAAIDTTTEFLIMNLSLNQGDTFIITPWGCSTPKTAIVDSIYYYNGIKHIRLNYQLQFLSSMLSDKLTFIEGIGPNTGVENIIPCQYLLCSYKNEQKVFTNYLIDTCDILINGLENMGFKEQYITIIPNPIISKGRLIFKNPYYKQFELTIFDILGNEIERQKTTKDVFIVNAISKNSGIYFFSIYNQNQKYHGKIVITQN